MAYESCFTGLKDKEWKKQKARINALVEKWVKSIGLGFWKIHFSFHDNMQSRREGESGFVEPLMSCLTHWEYLEARINVNLGAVLEMEDDELEQAFVHELMHIFVNEMREWKNFDESINHEERVVTQLAKAMIWATTHVKHKKNGDQKKKS